MLTKKHSISIKTLADYHLQDFISCPYKFYYQHIMKLSGEGMEWKQVVQHAVNQIVSTYYKLPFEQQTSFCILKLLEQYWRPVSPAIFESKAHYYMVTAKITDHLLQFLQAQRQPPLFLYEKFASYIEELGIQLSLTFEIGEWSHRSFILKKYMVETNEELLHLFRTLTAVFSQKAFAALPERIEFISLLEGKRYKYTPTMDDVYAGIEYLNAMKDLVTEPEHFSKKGPTADCLRCPFRKHCKYDKSRLPSFLQ